MLTENLALAIGLSRTEAALRRRLDAPLGSGHGIGFTDFQILAESLQSRVDACAPPILPSA